MSPESVNLKSKISNLESQISKMPLDRKKIKSIEKSLGARFRKKRLLIEALTHPSYRRESSEPGDNQRLEFLGDAVLHLIFADRIFRANPAANEGAMTEARRDIEHGGALASKARALGLDGAILVGKSEAASALPSADKTMEDAFEALIGALWLDRGLKHCVKTIDRLFSAEFSVSVPDEAQRDAERDPKSALQNLAQRDFKTQPEYISEREEGSAHNRVFYFTVRIAGCEACGAGSGRSKKEAQVAAATNLLSVLSEESTGKKDR